PLTRAPLVPVDSRQQFHRLGTRQELQHVRLDQRFGQRLELFERTGSQVRRRLADMTGERVRLVLEVNAGTPGELAGRAGQQRGDDSGYRVEGIVMERRAGPDNLEPVQAGDV